ncbi:Hypothetical predicted protein [Mytilus galloprovincialis]|uniref:Tripartite motif-containing protein n=1 Tax=Mytilus galloprovincialis TaxID=29158 RepID=A0A8B6CD66_MYTGA|nr:Hypothetical predicted protein [Mytilus galloprovincialis]
MAHGNYSEIESKCGICLSAYTEPRLLQCFHTFCTPCLEKVDVHDNYLTCPLCRTKNSMPEKGVSGFKTYPFHAEPSHNDKNLTDICEFCSDENTAVAKCLNCKINLCLNCRDYHKKIKASHNHSLENLNLDQLLEHKENSSNECDDHRKELTLFCKPCNVMLCSECSEKSHHMHEFQNLDLLIQTRKKILLARTRSLKSRISVLGHTEELVKQEENNYYKHLNIVKREILAHTKKDIKEIDTYLNEIETEQLSLAGLIKTSEDFITKSPDKLFIDDFFTVGSHLNQVLNKTLDPLTLHKLNYECKEFTEATVEKLLGKVNTSSKEDVLTPVYTQLPIPKLFPQTEKVHSFQLKSQIKDVVAANNDNVWIFDGKSASLYNHDGTKRSTYAPPIESKRMLRKSADELWFWTEKSAVRRLNMKYQEGFKVSFQNGSVGCFIQNGNLLVYNKEERVIYEVSEHEGFKNKTEIKDPKNKLQNTDFFTSRNTDIMMVETMNSNLVMSWRNNSVIITDNRGIVLDTFTRPNAGFRGITVDNYGHILVADYENDYNIDILSENGVFQRNLLHNQNRTTRITTDECGLLWVFDYDNTMKIFSYQ